MLKIIFSLLIYVNFIFSAHAMSDVETHFRINGKDTNKIMPGAPTTIEVWYTDPRTEENEVYKEFKKMHGKIMHMVLIKKDLSEFKHIHPYLDPITGRFQITINLPLSDPDNFHTQNTLTSAGMWMLMADVDIRGVGMRMGHKMLMSMGQAVNTPLKIDPVDGDMSISKFFKENGIDYKVKMQHEMTAGCAGRLVNFRVTLYEKNKEGAYVAAEGLEPWLSQGAHSVWLSEGLMHKHKMHFAHMHSMMPVDDSVLEFNFHDKNIMKAGVQKIWFQIKHKGKVLTIPFTFEYYPTTVTGDGC